MDKRYSVYKVILLGIIISIITLLADLRIENDYDLYLLYLIPLLLVFQSYLSRRYILSIAAVNTIFIILKFYIPPYETPGASTFNRIFFIPIMWIVAYIQLQRKKAWSIADISAMRFRRIIESNIAGFVIYDEEGHILEANDYYLNIIGHSRQEVQSLKLKWQDITPEEYIPFDNKANEEMRITGISAPYEKEYISKTGERKWILIAKTTLPGIENHYLSFVVDITRRKQAELALARNEFKLSEAQRIAHMGSYSLDYASGSIEWSDEMYRIYEKAPKSWTPSLDAVIEYVHPEDREYVLETVSNVNMNKVPYQIEFRIIPDNKIVKYLSNTIEPTFDGSGEVIGVFGIALDITERRLQEKRLQEIMTNLERSNKELEQFAYIASHDLQEPLRTISTALGLLSRNYLQNIDEKAKEYIKIVIDSSKRMGSLIKDLLAFSRITTRARGFTATDLNSLVQTILHDLQTSIKEHQAVIKVENLPVINADEVQMRQLFQNLISNALKFKGDKAPEIEISSRRERYGWLFSIKDNGIGIEPEYREKIFLIFQRLHDREKYPGTGIGLAICKKIVEHHGGKIWVESGEGKGAAFYFTIPAV